MFIPRIYQATPLAVDAIVKLSSEAASHLVRVLRLQVNDDCKLFNGEGGEYSAQIISIAKNNVSVRLLSFSAREVESPLHLHLGQGIARGDKMDYVIQKAVELGVQQITPLIMLRCSGKLSSERWEKRLQHWRAVAISACEQCGRNRLPHIFAPQPLHSWLKELRADLKLICEPTATVKLKNFQNNIVSLALLIGPESGMAQEEIDLAATHDFTSINLGPRVLRTETAAIAAVAAVQSYFGDLG